MKQTAKQEYGNLACRVHQVDGSQRCSIPIIVPKKTCQLIIYSSHYGKERSKNAQSGLLKEVGRISSV